MLNSFLVFSLWLLSPLLLLVQYALSPLIRVLKPYAPPPSVQGICIYFTLSFRLATAPTISTLYTSTLHILHPLLANPFLALTSPRDSMKLIGRVLSLLSPTNTKRVFMAHVWKSFGPGLDEGSRAIKEELIRDARGVVLDIGAGNAYFAPCIL